MIYIHKDDFFEAKQDHKEKEPSEANGGQVLR